MTSEEVNMDGMRNMLEMIPPDINGLERAVVCNDGTVQMMLSAIFCAPVKVVITKQVERASDIMRDVELVAIQPGGHEYIVCKAWSTIQKKGLSPGFLTGIQEQNMGIGQLISALGINTNRRIMYIGADKTHFVRHYEIKEIPRKGVPGYTYARNILSISINEQFPRGLYAIKGV